MCPIERPTGRLAPARAPNGRSDGRARAFTTGDMAADVERRSAQHLCQSGCKIAVVSFRAHPPFGAIDSLPGPRSSIEELVGFAGCAPHANSAGITAAPADPADPPVWELDAIAFPDRLRHLMPVCPTWFDETLCSSLYPPVCALLRLSGQRSPSAAYAHGSQTGCSPPAASGACIQRC
jgi:hypothetical protein